MLDLAGQRVLVLGLGISGRSAAAFCAGRGAHVVAADEGDARGLAEELRGVELRVAEPFPDPAAFDLVVPSPGVPKARYAGRARRVWGDVELAFRALAVPVVAVTGTNGKSTTVRLVEAMLRASGLRAQAAGNVGEPALGLVGLPLDVAILEVSSFQLEAVDAFRPRVAVLLNVSEDHLDRHGSLERYAATKARIFARQEPSDVAVVNGDDPLALRLAEACRARLRVFRRAGPVPEGAWWDAGAIALAADAGTLRLPLDAAAAAEPGVRANALAALLAAQAAGADPARAVAALAAFAPLRHRMQRVGEHAGVVWIDDSKATNPGAAARALASLEKPTIWIAGGRDKGLCFDSLAELAAPRVRHALLVGEAAEKLAEALRGRVPVELVGDLEAAVTRAARLARPGDAVLLSPACSSFDQFADFAERGERFRDAVTRLVEKEAP